jgi:hypothetical protein
MKFEGGPTAYSQSERFGPSERGCLQNSCSAN